MPGTVSAPEYVVRTPLGVGTSTISITPFAFANPPVPPATGWMHRPLMSVSVPGL